MLSSAICFLSLGVVGCVVMWFIVLSMMSLYVFCYGFYVMFGLGVNIWCSLSCNSECGVICSLLMFWC